MKLIMGMQADIASIKTSLNTMVNTNTVAIEALHSTQSAHHRIAELKDEIKEMRAAQRWLIGFTISAVGLFISAIGFLWKAAGL